MDMQLYTLHVVPVVVITYGIFVLFLHPPFRVIAATLVGGLVMAVLNMLGDLGAIHASLWYYNASGLVGHLPLPFYTTQVFILGGLAYLLIWRLWRGPNHWFALTLLIGVPILGLLRDFWQTQLAAANSFLLWKSSLAWEADLVLWPVMFFSGYLIFRAIAPAYQAGVRSESSPAVHE